MNTQMNKDELYELFKEPTREKLREHLTAITGESNQLDFKAKCPPKEKLAKLVLAMANSGGGIIFIGAQEVENSTQLDYVGLTGIDIRDHTAIGHDIEKYVPNALQYEIRDYSFESSEYPALINKTFQVIYVLSNPVHLPYMCISDGTNMQEGAIYIRRNTANELVNMEELSSLIEARLVAERSQANNLELSEHLDQLSLLCRRRPRYNGDIPVRNSLFERALLGFQMPQNNPTFVRILDEMIAKKRNLIMKCLGITE